jgi:hypothetical protein
VGFRCISKKASHGKFAPKNREKLKNPKITLIIFGIFPNFLKFSVQIFHGLLSLKCTQRQKIA